MKVESRKLIEKLLWPDITSGAGKGDQDYIKIKNFWDQHNLTADDFNNKNFEDLYDVGEFISNYRKNALQQRKSSDDLINAFKSKDFLSDKKGVRDQVKADFCDYISKLGFSNFSEILKSYKPEFIDKWLDSFHGENLSKTNKVLKLLDNKMKDVLSKSKDSKNNEPTFIQAYNLANTLEDNVVKKLSTNNADELLKHPKLYGLPVSDAIDCIEAVISGVNVESMVDAIIDGTYKDIIGGKYQVKINKQITNMLNSLSAKNKTALISQLKQYKKVGQLTKATLENLAKAFADAAK